MGHDAAIDDNRRCSAAHDAHRIDTRCCPSLPLPFPSPDLLTPPQDEILRSAVDKYGARNWKTISSCLQNRTDVQCLHRWQKVLRPGLVKGPWTEEVRVPRRGRRVTP
jgi:hypothetical protein